MISTILAAALSAFLSIGASSPSPASARPAANAARVESRTPALDSEADAPSVITVRARKHTTRLHVVRLGGAPMVEAARLAKALGGTFRATSPGEYALVVGDGRVSFTEGVPFAGSDTTIMPTVVPPRVVAGEVYVPFVVVSELVPRFFTGFIYDADRSELRVFDTSARTVRPAPAVARTNGNDGAHDGAAGDSGTDAFTRTTADDRAASHAAPGSGIISAADVGRPVPSRRSGHHLVVVDAGHGGVDAGMHGPIGGSFQITEKYITVAVAKMVAEELKAQGTDVILTRTRDTLIGLYDRGPIANDHHADVFVSIHVNATGQRGAAGVRDRGFETYFLSEAKTEDAKRVERMENSAIKFETGASAPKGDPLSFILNDMAQNEHLRESRDLARIIQHGLGTFEPGPDRGVQQANFAVLRGSFMPAVLVEIGFGTNPSEAAFLREDDNQRTIARSIAKSILAYLDRYDARVGAGR
jgi:N-acetylmuramoyl-L-alanine amidase